MTGREEVVHKPGGGIITKKIPDKQEQAETPIQLGNVISILISSEFLKIDALVDECLNFIVIHLSEIVRLPIDLNCINKSLLKKLAMQLEDLQIDKMKDVKDKLQSKLFMKKLELLIQDDLFVLQRCIYCCKLFPLN